MVTKDGKVKLADFGFARSVPQLEGQWTAYVSTRWYRAPEMLLGSEYGAAADIWAFGCILAEMATGEQHVVCSFAQALAGCAESEHCAHS